MPLTYFERRRDPPHQETRNATPPQAQTQTSLGHTGSAWAPASSDSSAATRSNTPAASNGSDNTGMMAKFHANARGAGVRVSAPVVHVAQSEQTTGWGASAAATSATHSEQTTGWGVSEDPSRGNHADDTTPDINGFSSSQTGHPFGTAMVPTSIVAPSEHAKPMPMKNARSKTVEPFNFGPVNKQKSRFLPQQRTPSPKQIQTPSDSAADPEKTPTAIKTESHGAWSSAAGSGTASRTSSDSQPTHGHIGDTVDSLTQASNGNQQNSGLSSDQDHESETPEVPEAPRADLTSSTPQANSVVDVVELIARFGQLSQEREAVRRAVFAGLKSQDPKFASLIRSMLGSGGQQQVNGESPGSENGLDNATSNMQLSSTPPTSSTSVTAEHQVEDVLNEQAEVYRQGPGLHLEGFANRTSYLDRDDPTHASNGSASNHVNTLNYDDDNTPSPNRPAQAGSSFQDDPWAASEQIPAPTVARRGTIQSMHDPSQAKNGNTPPRSIKKEDVLPFSTGSNAFDVKIRIDGAPAFSLRISDSMLIMHVVLNACKKGNATPNKLELSARGEVFSVKWTVSDCQLMAGDELDLDP
ncbi:hypothetical protein BDZ85DRAFT_263059 [Elsinoe ampelina]|uniref:Uncharacterized protein n=1 Tax=Elsinoe ampelina TaxID=302913 RepID=A0A6A6GC27_9PEZI|nr:hypothetical protein BDZ85DRAFT_263059 [Elsinoe ampelina]